MAQGKQAKPLSAADERTVLAHLQRYARYPTRDKVKFLLSIKAGLRAKEIAHIAWPMVTDANGHIGEVIALENRVSKGKKGGRTIPMHPELRLALIELHEWWTKVFGQPPRNETIIFSERSAKQSAAAVTVWFHRLYKELGLHGCSSHSGRRTFITRTARKLSQVDGSLRDVQQMAGHANLQTTAGYIEGDTETKRKLVSMI